MDATINSARIHYERAGSGLPLILLHAGIADVRMWEPQIGAFAQQFDRLHLKPVHLIGCSLGAMLAIDFSLEHPDRISKLVLVGPAIGGANFGTKYPEVFAEAKAAEESGNVDAQNLAEMHLFLDGPRRRRGYVKESLRDLFLNMNGPNLRIDWESAPSPDLNPPAAERLHEITAPVLVIVGDEDVPTIFDAVDLLMDATINSARIHYERAGSGLPLILLHAGIADVRMWEPQIGAFAQQFTLSSRLKRTTTMVGVGAATASASAGSRPERSETGL